MELFEKQLDRMHQADGFIAALDQSGGSTPKALLEYGIKESEYHDEDKMFDLIHDMRTRVMTDEHFKGEKILGVILFDKTLNSTVAGIPTTEYLSNKNILSFLKIDLGLEAKEKDVQRMKAIPNLAGVIQEAKRKGVFGTKMRSVIYGNNKEGITEIVKQQFDFASIIIENGLVPIIEPEVDIYANDKKQIEFILKEEIVKQLNRLTHNQKVMLKLTLPSQDNLYTELIEHPQVVRVVALSGGYDLDEATELLKRNKGMIASFSRALLNDLRVDQTNEEFSTTLSTAINCIYNASIT